MEEKEKIEHLSGSTIPMQGKGGEKKGERDKKKEGQTERILDRARSSARWNHEKKEKRGSVRSFLILQRDWRGKATGEDR